MDLEATGVEKDWHEGFCFGMAHTQYTTGTTGSVMND